MLKRSLEIFCNCNVTNQEFEVIMGMTKQDVCFNRIYFGKRTSRLTLMEIAHSCAKLYYRMEL